MGSKGTHLDRFAQYQPAATFRQSGEPRSEPGFLRNRYHRVAGQLDLSQPSGAAPAAALARIVFAGVLYLGQSIDDASGFFNTTGDPNFPQNGYDLGAERGRSDFDIRQRFTLSYAYDLPVFKGHRCIGGWQGFAS